MRIIDDLALYKNPQKAKILARFFKTGKGEYGEGDQFWGIVVPKQREVARRHRDADISEIESLLAQPIHECRLTALLLLVEKNKRASESERAAYYKFYLSHTAYINNWDLVDLSARDIVGAYLVDHPDARGILVRLGASSLIWERRIGVLATWALFRNHEYTEAIALYETLLTDTHDLIHKAVGWMLRELGKVNIEVEEAFLNKHARIMPRTMLRYAIERFPYDKRRFYMG